MSKLIKKDKWTLIGIGSVLAIAGIITIVLAIADKSKLNSIFSIIVAISLFVLGGLLIIASLLKTSYSLLESNFLSGSVAIALGVILCIETGLLPSILIYVIAISILSFGVAVLIRGIILTTKKAPTKYYVFAYIFSAVLITAGILGLIFRSETQSFVYILAGIALLVFGVVELVEGIKKLTDK